MSAVGGGRALSVTRVETLALIEDAGRPGWARLGIPPSGALDPEALALANRLVGNPESAAGLEILLGGIVARAGCSMRIALTGAQLPLTVAGRPAPWGTQVPVGRGSTIEVGRGGIGLRGWLAISGGIDVPPVLGSRSTCTLSRLGPAPLEAGDVLPLGEPAAPATAGVSAPGPSWPAGPVALRVDRGPRADWFEAGSLAGLWGTELTVSSAADRVAVRLCGGAHLVRRIHGELASEGLVTGAVQVPGDGQPLVFLNDRPTTGGYPVIGVVDPADLPRCAQLRPGDQVRLEPLWRD